MSCYLIYYQDNKKLCRPIGSLNEYMQVRNSQKQQTLLTEARRGNTNAKRMLAQFNYSCIPTEEDGIYRLKGCTTPSTSVGMDLDFDKSDERYEEKMLEVPNKVLALKEELGLLMLERSATKGFHLVFRRRTEMSQVENLQWASDLLGVRYDEGAKDITRVFFTTTGDRDELLYVDEALFENESAPVVNEEVTVAPKADTTRKYADDYLGVPYAEIIAKWWQLYNGGQEPIESNRNTLTFELAVNLRHICGFNRDHLAQIIPCYDGFPEEEKMACIDNALKEPRKRMPMHLVSLLQAVKADHTNDRDIVNALEEVEEEDLAYYINKIGKTPMGIRDSLQGVPSSLHMPVLSAITSMIGALATGVKLDVHGDMRGLNLLCYVVGRAASGKGQLDEMYNLWMHNLLKQEESLFEQEEEYERTMKAAKNRQKQPEERHFPHRLADEVSKASLIDLLKYSEGKHVFLFSSEADTANSNTGAWADLSAIFRKAYDGARYNRRFKSAESTKANISEVLLNCVYATTPGGLFRAIRNNVENGVATRLLIARTPVSTFSSINIVEKRSQGCEKNVKRIAGLLELMHGDIVLPRLENLCLEWLEKVRLETLKNDDPVRADLRKRAAVTAMRMTMALLLCSYAETLIRKHRKGAEDYLKTHPFALQDELPALKAQGVYDAFEHIADYVLDNLDFYFHKKMKPLYEEDYEDDVSMNSRKHKGTNDSVFASLPEEFSLDDAKRAKGTNSSTNAIRCMVKNWKRQGLIVFVDKCKYKKIE